MKVRILNLPAGKNRHPHFTSFFAGKTISIRDIPDYVLRRKMNTIALCFNSISYCASNFIKQNRIKINAISLYFCQIHPNSKYLVIH